MRALFTIMLNIALILWPIFIILIITLGIGGCSKDTQYINVPIAMQCDYNLTALIVPDINSTQGILNSIILIGEDYKKLRNDIMSLPCIRIIQ